MLVHVKQIINKAVKTKYATGAFNFYNFETLIGIIKAAKELRSPIILQVSEGQAQYMGAENIMALVKSATETFGKNVPIALHLDHGYNFNVITKCVKAGFSSVHIDGSFLSWQKNIDITKRVVKYAHQRNVWVQGELGSILGQAGLKRIQGKFAYEKTLTDPVKAQTFVKLTGVDTLAISVGALHGIYRGQEKIDFNRLRTIKALVKVPLVMHGSSGLSKLDIKKAVNLGVKIFNVATLVRAAFWQSIKKGINQRDDDYNLRKILILAEKAVGQQVEQMIGLLKRGN